MTSIACIKGSWCCFENCSGRNRRSRRKKSTTCFCNGHAQNLRIIWCLKPKILWTSHIYILWNIFAFQYPIHSFIGCQKIGLVEKHFFPFYSRLSSFKYRTSVIIVCIIFTHFLEFKNVFSMRFFLKILSLCMVSIQEQFLISERSEHFLNQNTF